MELYRKSLLEELGIIREKLRIITSAERAERKAPLYTLVKQRQTEAGECGAEPV